MINKNILLALIIAICSFSSVLALGVTAPYWDERPLVMSPGETKDIQFELQNMVGESNATLRAGIIQGGEIAKLTDRYLDYEVPAGVKNVKVNMEIKIPRDAEEGNKYTIGVSFNTLSQTDAGQFQLGSAFEKYFDVLIQEKTQEDGFTILPGKGNTAYLVYVIILLILIAIIAIVYVLRKRKNN